MSMTRFNVFQHLVRQWDGLHPYNAAQVLRLRGTPDTTTIATAWHETLSRLGLGKLKVDGQRFGYETLNGQSSRYPLNVVGAERSLEDFISDELNRPFESESYLPFRPFIKSENGSFYLGVVYQHWVADSASIRMLLQEWFAKIFDPSAIRESRIRHAGGGYWQVMGPGKARWPLLNGFLASVRWSSRFKRVRRIEQPEFSDFRVRFSMHRLPAGAIDAFHETARAAHCKLNDFFLAGIAEACHLHVPAVTTSKRQDLALGTIVDLRPHTTDDLDDVFGLFLGFTSVVCRPRDLEDFQRLIGTIAAQNAIHKMTGFAQASPVRMLAGIVAGKMLSREGTVRFYRKRVPLAGGISNVNLNHTWAADYHPDPLLEYIRVSPTGPMMPLVFTTTTLGNAFHFGLTVRESVMPPARAQALADAFVERLQKPVASR